MNTLQVFEAAVAAEVLMLCRAREARAYNSSVLRQRGLDNVGGVQATFRASTM
jgi:hypothetical protein